MKLLIVGYRLWEKKSDDNVYNRCSFERYMTGIVVDCRRLRMCYSDLKYRVWMIL